ncbi:MAG: DUF4391 family protein [Sphingobacteriales bacterium]|nr:MAG: DUF4391 family protein [Sphingobacteriales bacterium]
MIKFILPASTIVDRIVPKNAFDAYTNNAQKKKMSSLVEKIRWAHKLSLETLNLPGNAIRELEIIEVTLRGDGDIHPVLDVIDRAIPYPILFILEGPAGSSLRLAAKHPSPASEDNAVIDWVFTTSWQAEGPQFALRLERNLDQVHFEACKNISGTTKPHADLPALINYMRTRTEIDKKIQRIRQEMGKDIQFNRKVALNIALKKAQDMLGELEKG